MIATPLASSSGFGGSTMNFAGGCSAFGALAVWRSRAVGTEPAGRRASADGLARPLPARRTIAVAAATAVHTITLVRFGRNMVFPPRFARCCGGAASNGQSGDGAVPGPVRAGRRPLPVRTLLGGAGGHRIG